MILNTASQPVVSIKFTESASRRTCFAGGRLAAFAAFRPSSRWPMLAKVDCTEEEKTKIAGGNAARIYHLN